MGWVGLARQDQSREEAVDVTVTAAITRLPGGHEGSGVKAQEAERAVRAVASGTRGDGVGLSTEARSRRCLQPGC